MKLRVRPSYACRLLDPKDTVGSRPEPEVGVALRALRARLGAELRQGIGAFVLGANRLLPRRGSVNLPPNVPFQGGGASTGQAILVLPPGHSNYDFVKLSYFNLDLDPTRAWSFQTRIGIQQANNTAAGVRFQVVVGGDRKQPFNTPRASTPGSRCGRRTSSHVREVSLPSAGRART